MGLRLKPILCCVGTSLLLAGCASPQFPQTIKLDVPDPGPVSAHVRDQRHEYDKKGRIVQIGGITKYMGDDEISPSLPRLIDDVVGKSLRAAHRTRSLNLRKLEASYFFPDGSVKIEYPRYPPPTRAEFFSRELVSLTAKHGAGAYTQARVYITLMVGETPVTAYRSKVLGNLTPESAMNQCVQEALVELGNKLLSLPE